MRRERIGVVAFLLMLFAGAGCSRTSLEVPSDESDVPADSGRRGAPSVGGAPSAGGASSSGGSSPIAGIAPPRPTSKVDLLLMIDSSISMGDKQQLLANALPLLLERLATPHCVDAGGVETGVKASSNGVCSKGKTEFRPVNDIHIALITSDLGAHGGQTCAEKAGDQAQLLPKVRELDPNFPYRTWNDSGVLAWDPSSNANSPPGENRLSSLEQNLANMTASVGQKGCGFEASLEAWYRFLIDPDPPEFVPQVTDASTTTMPFVPDPAHNPILQQRAAFLRPDSLLLILMLTDENDCSIRDDGQGWIVGQQSLGGKAFFMPRATAVCETNANDPCCSSCAASAVSGCPDPQSDPSCQRERRTRLEDNLNLRCWDQKRRFGFDLLYPLERYVDGLTQPKILRSNGEAVENPLFPQDGRNLSMVYLGGILGVPWQDLATKESLVEDAPLEYLNHPQLTSEDRWSLVLGSLGDATTAPSAPRDKLMFETFEDRTLLFGRVPHPLLGSAAALAPATSVGQENAINGHESNLADRSELQYACIFALPTARECAESEEPCDCSEGNLAHNPAVCDGTTQTHEKAFPGVRELRVLKAFGDLTGNAITTSICPKTLDAGNPDSGYAPNVAALVNGLKRALAP